LGWTGGLSARIKAKVCSADCGEGFIRLFLYIEELILSQNISAGNEPQNNRISTNRLHIDRIPDLGTITSREINVCL
jgi:hypothetical protein